MRNDEKLEKTMKNEETTCKQTMKNKQTKNTKVEDA